MDQSCKKKPGPWPRLLPPRQKAVLQFVYRFLKKHQQSPTHAEIKKHLGGCISSVSSVAFHLQELQKKGYLCKEKHKKRGIQILEAGIEILKKNGNFHEKRRHQKFGATKSNSSMEK